MWAWQVLYSFRVAHSSFRSSLVNSSVIKFITMNAANPGRAGGRVGAIPQVRPAHDFSAAGRARTLKQGAGASGARTTRCGGVPRSWHGSCELRGGVQRQARSRQASLHQQLPQPERKHTAAVQRARGPGGIVGWVGIRMCAGPVVGRVCPGPTASLGICCGGGTTWPCGRKGVGAGGDLHASKQAMKCAGSPRGRAALLHSAVLP